MKVIIIVYNIVNTLVTINIKKKKEEEINKSWNTCMHVYMYIDGTNVYCWV